MSTSFRARVLATRERFHSIAALSVLGLGLGGCGFGELELEQGSSVEEIRGGSLDGSHAFAVDVGGFCTGTLITPRWVLTANHCITGYNSGTVFASSDAYRVKDDIVITIVPAGQTSISAGVQFMHTNAVSGDVIVVKDGKMDLGTNGEWDGALDMALIKLDQPVPLSVAAPMHPPLLLGGGPACTQSGEFPGEIIGYADDTDRRYNTIEDWVRGWVAPDRAVYQREWVFYVPLVPGFEVTSFSALIIALGDNGTFYNGIEPGDSGGPLVSNGRFCGVASGIQVGETGCELPPWLCTTITDVFSAVDSPAAQTFLAAHIITTDEHGNPVFEGECSEGGMVDSDGDGLWDGCDPCPDPADPDSDGDGLCNSDDVCPTVNNPQQVDTDGDGRGDLCDKCPADPGTGSGELLGGDEFGDTDGDHLCDSVDNCPLQANWGQENANEDWEKVHTPGDLRGDLCEPVPQPALDVKTEGGGTVKNGGFWVAAFHEDSFRFDPQGSLSESPLGPTVPVPYVAPGSVCSADGCVGATEFRFCQVGPNNTPPFCDDAAALDEAELHHEYGSALDELPTDPWHRITLDFGDSSVPTRGQSLPVSYDGVHDRDIEWRYEEDGAFWFANGQVSEPSPVPSNPGFNLSGYLWAHVPTDVGNTNDVGTGLHGPQLANVIVPIDVNYFGSSGHGPVWDEGIPIINHVNHPLPDIWDPFMVLQFGVFTFHVTAEMRELPSFLSEDTVAVLTRGTTWVSAEEKLGNLGMDAPLAISFSAVHGARAARGPRPSGGFQGLWFEGGKFVTGELEIASQPPFAWERAAMTYSRTLGALFAVSSGELWRLQLNGREQPWTRLALDVELGEVIDMTVAYGDDGLYVLDLGEGGRSVRLWRIDLHSGDAARLGAWDRRTESHVSIELDRKGLPVITSSDRRRYAFAGIGLTRERLDVRYAGNGEGDLLYPITDTERGPTAYLSVDDGVELFVPRLDTGAGVDVLGELF